MVTTNYQMTEIPFTSTGCVTKGSSNGGLNHFEVRVSQGRVEVWATDAGAKNLHQIAVAPNAGLSFTRGVIWIEDVHYNACKDADNQCDHQLSWDNVGFDGPKPYRDLTFDLPDAGLPVPLGLQLGHTINGTPWTFNIAGVNWLSHRRPR